MTYRVEKRGKTLSVSFFENETGEGVLVNISAGGECKAVALTREEARMLHTDLGEMLGRFEVPE